MKPLPDGARIVIFRALQLGDMLCAIPALRALRHAEPNAHVTLIGLPWAAGFARRFSGYIDDFMAFPGAAELPEQAPDAARLSNFYDAAQQRHFDLAIQLHGSGRFSNAITAALGARQSAGFVPDDKPLSAPIEPAGNWLPWPEHLPEIERYLHLLRHLGYEPQGSALEFPLARGEVAAWRALCQARRLQAGKYVCVHPGARMPSRRWPSQRFATVASQLAAQGWSIVLTGTAEEIGLAQDFRSHMQYPFIDLCGVTTLGGLAALIADSCLLICNDTGVSHLAAALRTPSLVVACGSDVARWAPLDRELHTVLADYPACRPCMEQVCRIGHLCAMAISAAQVTHTALQMLATEKVSREAPHAAHPT